MPDYIENAVEGSGGFPHLVLGDTASADGRDPTLITGPPRLLSTAGFFTVDHHYAHCDAIPSLANGCAIFFYGELPSLGGLPKYLCGVEDGGSQDHSIGVDGSNKAFALVTENTGGAPRARRRASRPS